MFTVCDLKSAFYRLDVEEDSTQKFTFVTPHRESYKFLRAPMGFTTTVLLH